MIEAKQNWEEYQLEFQEGVFFFTQEENWKNWLEQMPKSKELQMFGVSKKQE